MKKENNINKKKIKLLSKILSLGSLAVVLITCYLFIRLNLVSIWITLLGIVIFLIVYVFILRLSFSRKKAKRFFGDLFLIIIILLLSVGSYYMLNTLDLFSNIKSDNVKYETYNVIVLKSSKYKDIKDLKNKTMGVSDSYDKKGLDGAKDKINKKVNVKYKNYDDMVTLSHELINEDVESIVLESAEMDILKEENYEEYQEYKVIYKVEVKSKVKDLKKGVNILKDPFNIYISGVDTYGKINSATRSDVNMVLTVNPKKEKIHITWIPRDYYIHINNSTYKDKLTHAGIYGIDSSIYAISNLLDTDINYYVKVNFTSLINIVDALGGINVYNDQYFVSQDGYSYNKGNINLDGKHALSFVRERKNLPHGDMSRGSNQVKVLSALIEKAKSPKIITKYNTILNSLDNKFVTNMDVNDIIKYIKEEIKNPKDYEITDYTLDGTSGYEYTYSYKKQKLSVVKPDEEMVNTARKQIKDTLNVD